MLIKRQKYAQHERDLSRLMESVVGGVSAVDRIYKALVDLCGIVEERMTLLSSYEHIDVVIKEVEV